MIIPVKVPAVGESITEGILAEWKVSDGANVKVDDPIFELETDKVSMTVTAEKAGRITLSAKVGDTVLIGGVVATIDTDAVGQVSNPVNPVAVAPTSASGSIERPAETPVLPEAVLLSPTAGIETLKANLADLAPSVRRIVAEEHLNPAQIVGTGKAGRITKEDALNAVVGQVSEPVSVLGGQVSEPVYKELPSPQILNLKSEILNPAPPPFKNGDRTTRKPMSSLRHRIAERMVESQHNSATLTTFNEVDMSAVMTARTHLQEPFQAKYGIKLGFMSFFVKAVVEALKAVPAVNAQIDGDSIIENHFYDIGVAVSTERGLVVPVIRDADSLGFADLETAIAHYADKARKRTITLDELQGGVFTISNGGVFGSMLSTPILNPPQPGILGLHGIKKRPVVLGDTDQIVVRPMMYLALSYDHRLIDGRESVAFLKKIVECIEMPERLMMGV